MFNYKAPDKWSQVITVFYTFLSEPDQFVGFFFNLCTIMLFFPPIPYLPSIGKTTPDFSLTPSRTTPFSPASTFEAKPGSPTNETVPPPVSQAVNFTETSLSTKSVAFIATSASLTISGLL